MQKKKGISLIVLVITIIVMIIISGTIISALSDNGIIGKAQEAVNKMNLAEVQNLAQLAWAEAYLNNERTDEQLKAAVEAALKAQEITAEDYQGYTMIVTTSGVKFVKGESVEAETTGTAILLEDVATIPHKVKITGNPGTRVYISGKNIYYNAQLPVAGETFEKNGVVFTGNEDGTVTLNGTSTAGIGLYDKSPTVNLGVGSYVGLPGIGYSLSWNVDSEIKYLVSVGKAQKYDVTTFTTPTMSSIYINKNVTFDNFILYPYVEINSYAVSGMQYEKFKGISEYIISNEGFVEVDCIAPNMTVIADNNVTVNYKKTTISEYPLRDKTIMFFGDSITASPSYYRKKLLDLSQMNQAAAFAVAGATLRNSDSTVLDGNPTESSNNTITNQVQKLLNSYEQYNTPEIIVIFAGTNDSHQDNISVQSQMSCSLDECDLTSFAGALRWSTEKIRGLYPNATIYVVTPLKSFAESRTDEIQGIKTNILKETANALNLNIIDVFTGVNIVKTDLVDNIHPSETGAQKIAEYLYQELLNKQK